MSDEDVVKLVVYTRLKGLRQNLSAELFTEGRYGDDFHEILQELKEVWGFDLDKYRLPDSSFPHDDDDPSYCVDCTDLKMKADALLDFFTISPRDASKKIGFMPG